jgi:alpha-tubulin suppressor-like RCC1 family protein
MKKRAVVLAVAGIVIVALCVVTLGRSSAKSTTASQGGSTFESTTAPARSSPGHSDTKVYIWGNVYLGSLYDSKPTLVHGIAGTVTQIATSNSDTYALTSVGTVWAWGGGASGEIGDGETTPFVSTPTKVKFPAGVTIVSLPNPMPDDTGLAIDSQGNAWGWGYDHHSELCLSSYNSLLTPVKLPLTHVTLASGAGAHALFDSRGRVYACGLNSDGELGDGTTADSPTPTAVVGLPKGAVRALVSSWQGSGALMTDGSYYDWGYNEAGQLGNGRTTNSTTPVLVPLPEAVTHVSQGGSDGANGESLALLSDGSVWSWGNDRWGQLGDGLRENASSPVRVALPSGVTFSQVSSGGASSYAIDGTGHLWAWGQDNAGQLGIRATSAAVRPVPVGIVLSQVSSTAAYVAGL